MKGMGILTLGDRSMGAFEIVFVVFRRQKQERIFISTLQRVLRSGLQDVIRLSAGAGAPT